MKKTISILIVMAILASAIFSVASLSTTAYAEEVRNVEVVTAETELIASYEAEIHVDVEEPEVPMAAAPEATEEVEVTEAVEEPKETEENVPAHNEQVLDFLPTLLDEYEVSVVSYVYEGCSTEIDEECTIFTLDEMYFQCMELDADVKICVVEHEGTYYLVTEWSHGGRGYTPIYQVIYEDGEEFFFSFGEDFRRMTLKAYVCGNQMY